MDLGSRKSKDGSQSKQNDKNKSKEQKFGVDLFNKMNKKTITGG